MASDLTIHLDDQPGELARLGEVLGRAGVNIEGFCAVTSGGGSAEIHVLVEDPSAAFSALEAAGIAISNEDEVLVVGVDDRPGALGDLSRRLGEEGINISLAYLATETRLVLAADDLDKAKTVLQV